MKVETDIITRIAVSLIGRSGILMIMYVETYKTDVIVLINNVTLTNHYQYYSQFIDANNITLEKCQKY